MNAGYRPRARRFGTRVYRILILTTLLLRLAPAVGNPETRLTFQQGIESVKLRLYPQAADTFKSILENNPTHIDTQFQLANVYKLQDELELAIQTFNTLLTQLKDSNLPLNPTASSSENTHTKTRLQGLVHLALSEIYCQQSQLTIAAQHAKKAIERCPTDANTHYRLGYIYTHQAKFDAALAAFRRTLTYNPDFAEVYEWLGLIALMQQNPKQSVEYYQKAIARKPYVQSAYYNLAKAYRLLGDVAAATEQLKRFEQMKTYYDQTYAIESALAETPMNTALRLKLADIHLTHKHISAAITTYQSLIRLNPEFMTGYDKLGRLYMNLNQPELAIPFFQKVIALNPDAVEAHVRLGWLYTALKRYDKAEAELHAAIEKMPKLTLAYHGLAEIYIKQGHIQQAIAVYRHIITIAPGDSDAQQTLQNLEQLKRRSQTAQ